MSEVTIRVIVESGGAEQESMKPVSTLSQRMTAEDVISEINKVLKDNRSLTRPIQPIKLQAIKRKLERLL